MEETMWEPGRVAGALDRCPALVSQARGHSSQGRSFAASVYIYRGPRHCPPSGGGLSGPGAQGSYRCI